MWTQNGLIFAENLTHIFGINKSLTYTSKLSTNLNMDSMFIDENLKYNSFSYQKSKILINIRSCNNISSAT